VGCGAKRGCSQEVGAGVCARATWVVYSTQQDPIGLAGGLNLYGYGDGDPVNNADPFGLCVEPASCAVVLAAAAGSAASGLASAGVATVTIGAVAVGVGAANAAVGATYSVYRSITAGLDYVGITNNLGRRAAEQLRGRKIEIAPLISGLTRDQARGIEQVIIEAVGLKKEGGELVNRINSVARDNEKYEKLKEMGQELLREIGYDPKKP